MIRYWLLFVVTALVVIACVAVFGSMDHASGTERVVVLAETRQPDTALDEELKHRIYELAVGLIGAPVDDIVLAPPHTVPKTSSGKIQRHACRNEFLNNSLQVIAQWFAWSAGEEGVADEGADERATAHAAAAKRALRLELTGTVDPTVGEIVLDHVRAVAKERAKNLSLDSNILDLGLDSLERTEIAFSLQQTFGGRVPEAAALHAVASARLGVEREAKRARPERRAVFVRRALEGAQALRRRAGSAPARCSHRPPARPRTPARSCR